MNDANNANMRITKKDFMEEFYHLAYNPFIPDPCNRIEEYVQREDEVNRFERDINLLSISAASSYMVVGGKGLGKTSFVNICMQKAKERGFKTVYVSRVSKSAEKFMKDLVIATIEAETDLYKKKNLIDQYSNRIKTEKEPYSIFDIWTRIIELLQPKPVIIVIDETNSLPKIEDIAPTFNSYIFAHRKDVIFFLCALPEIYIKIYDNMGAFADRFPKLVNLPPFSKDELLLCLQKKLLIARTKTISSKFYPFNKSALNTLLEYANGVPRNIIAIADESINYGVENHIKTINKKIIDESASRIQRGILDETWQHLTYMDKETLIKIVELGGTVKLDELSKSLKRGKNTIIRYLNKLDANGIIERVGKSPKETRYKLVVDPTSIKRLIRKI